MRKALPTLTTVFAPERVAKSARLAHGDRWRELTMASWAEFPRTTKLSIERSADFALDNPTR
jgi:hypothetical protein